MRKSRLRKFKTNRKLKLAINILAVCYLSFFTLSYLSSGTGAYFNSVNEDKFSLEAGTWWDGSKLEFVGKGTQYETACPEPVVIGVELKNFGNKMIESTEYEVYFSESGEPQTSGESIDNGVIDPLNAGGTLPLEYAATEKGFYQFKVYQSKGYEDNYETISETWSEIIEVKCQEIEEDTQEEQDIEEELEETNQSDENAEEPAEQEEIVEEQEGKQKVEENVQKDEIPTEEVVEQDETTDDGNKNGEEKQEENKVPEEVEESSEENTEISSPKTKSKVINQETEFEEVEENESEENQ